MSKHLSYLKYVVLGILFLGCLASTAHASDPTPEAALADLNTPGGPKPACCR